MFTKSVRPALALLLVMTVLCGLIYPIIITGIARVLFPAQAAGSLIHADGKLIGSRLIGQNFTNPGYFWGRPSATTPQAYNGIASTGSNLGPSNPALIAQVKGNAARLRDADPTNGRPIPADLVTASASGLDPQISRAAARLSGGPCGQGPKPADRSDKRTGSSPYPAPCPGLPR